MKYILLLFLINGIGLDAFSQFLVLNDSLKIDFPMENEKMRIVNTQDDLTYSIIVTNISKKITKSYVQLVYEAEPSRFANYYWLLYKKLESDYILLPMEKASNSSGYILEDLNRKFDDKKQVDSAFAVYDLPKKDLLPFQSDTLRYNLLLGTNHFEPGDYMIRFFFRVGDLFALHKNMRESLGQNYVYSDSYYFFRVSKKLILDINNLPKSFK